MISVNLATFEGRKHLLPKVIESLKNQTVKPDVIRVWANDYRPDVDAEVYTGEDLTDNGKFAFLPWVKNEYYFTCDDDIEYPTDYIENTLYYLRKYPTYVITYHGRKLLGEGLDYYHDHKRYAFNRTVKGNWEIDAPGTGVTAFHTDLITCDPLKWKHKKMSDLMFGLECAKKNVPILCVQHPMFWLQPLTTNNDYTIYGEQHKDCSTQNSIANKIYRKKQNG